jgi:hypothetical protein
MVLTKRLISCPCDNQDNLSSIINILNLIGSVVFLVSAILAFFVPTPSIPKGGARSVDERTRGDT